MSNTPKTITRAALYIRVSTEEQALHGYSLEAQEAALKQYAIDHDYKVVHIYHDEGFSARKPVMRRKVMQELLADVQAGKIDLILFTKLDRWFRNVHDYHQVQAVLDKYGVAWKTILEDYQTTTADGRLKVNIMLSVAENEADRTSERIKFVFDNKVRNGEYCFGGPMAPYGYKAEVINGVRKLVKDPETESATAAFWDKMIKYHNTRRAARETNLEYGISRDHQSWRKVVRNKIYTGELRGIKDFCPAYISAADWQDIQCPERRIKSTQGDRHYLFVGLLRCPVCGRTLKATFKTYPNDRSKEYYGYRCTAKPLGCCTYSRQLSERKLEKYLVAHLRESLESYIAKLQLSASAPKKKRKKTDTTKLRDQLRRLNVIYLAGNISDDDYNAQANILRDAIIKAEQEEKQLAQVIDFTALRQLLDSNFELSYKAMSREEKQRFWHSIIAEIQLDDNQVKEIIFKS